MAVPGLIITARNVVLDNLLLEVVLNGGEPTTLAGQGGGDWSVTVDALPNQLNVLEMSWYERYRSTLTTTT